MKYSFVIKEKAIGKERPRKGKNGFYTPTKTKDFEDKVKQAFISKYPIDSKYMLKPFRAKISVFYEPAKSKSRKEKTRLIKERVYTKKPDCDNIAKSILDGLNGLAYKDDSQVVELLIGKHYSMFSEIQVELETIETKEQ